MDVLDVLNTQKQISSKKKQTNLFLTEKELWSYQNFSTYDCININMDISEHQLHNEVLK